MFDEFSNIKNTINKIIINLFLNIFYFISSFIAIKCDDNVYLSEQDNYGRHIYFST